MIFSTLLAVLFFSSSLVCSMRAPLHRLSVDKVKDNIEKIIEIIGHDLSPALSKFLSKEENWDFVLAKQNYFAQTYPFIGVSKTLNELNSKVQSNQGKITGDKSKLYKSYAEEMSLLTISNFSNFFSTCCRVLKLLAKMKGQVNLLLNENNYAEYKMLFEDAPTPIEFMKMLFDSFKSVAEDMPLTLRYEKEIRDELLLALGEFNPNPKPPSVSNPNITKVQQNSAPWTPLKRFLVFGGIGLVVPLSVIVAMVFFFRR